MGGNDERRRAQRLFWLTLVIAVTGVAWLWDQATRATKAGQLPLAFDLAAALLVTVCVLLLARLVWRLSGR